MLGRPALPRELQRRFWLMMRTGVVLDDAAATVGVSKAVAWRWFREAGGVLPALVPDHPESAARTFRLSFSEREEIGVLRDAGESIRAIARPLDRSPSTISRELARGTVRRKTGYRASVALPSPHKGRKGGPRRSAVTWSVHRAAVTCRGQ